MSQQHAYAEIAADWNLWNEFVNTDATMSRDEFDALSIEQKVQLQTDAFGHEPNQSAPTESQLEAACDWYNGQTKAALIQWATAAGLDIGQQRAQLDADWNERVIEAYAATLAV